MNKFQKSLDRIKKNVPLHEDSWTDEDKEHIITIIEALEKQIPKKLTNYSIDNNGYMIYDCECPSCKLSHREYYPFAYCNHCGQALDWSDTE